MRANASVGTLYAIDSGPSRDPSEVWAAMAGSPLFCGLTQEDCRSLAPSATLQTIEPDESLFLEGETIRDVIVIVSGAVKLSQRGPKGESIILRVSTAGDTPTIPLEPSHSRYRCAAHSIERCTVARWDVQQFHRIVARFPEIKTNIDLLVSQRMRELEEKFWELLTESAARRLAHTIIRLTESIGRRQSDGVFIPVTRDELARMSGMTMFTVSRYIAAWTDTGIIRRRRKGALVVENPVELLANCGDPYEEA